MSSTTATKNSTISSSGSSSSASTTNMMPLANQNSTPNSATNNSTPSFYFNSQQSNVGASSSPHGAQQQQQSNASFNILANLTNTPLNPQMPQSACTTPGGVATNNSNSSILHEERVYKKEKQILIEFDTKTKDLKQQLGEGTKCLEQRLDTQISMLYELQDFFKKRAEVELQYSRDLDKLTKNILSKHKSEKSKRENWPLHSTFKLWESLLNDTKQHSKYHQVASEVCSKYVAEKFDVIVDDIKRIFAKCKNVGQASHEEIFKVVGELNGAMKTYHEYQSESKQAEAKLKYVQSQKPKFEKQKSKKKLKQFEKQVEKRLQKYTETKVKAFKARNEYILSIESANACINKFCTEDIGDLVDCSDFGFHASVARCIYMYLSAQDNIKRSRQMSVDNLSRSIGDLDSSADKSKFLDYFQYVFNIQKKFQFEAHKGDEVSQVNAQSLIRYEMEKRFEQLDNRLKTLKTENNEIFKTIEATEESLLNFFDVKNNCDMTDLFRDLNLTNQNTSGKDKRIEIEDYYIEKVRQYTTSSNLIARLESRHGMMQKALCGRMNNSELFDKLSNQSVKDDQLSQKKKIGKSPIIGQPRLFGGKLTEYINATKQEIPPIITSCIKAINRLGLHNQGIFRIPGSQLEINQFKEAFEKGEDPLITVNPREMNSVAGVLKLYLRELKDPLFPRDMYDQFLNAMRINHQTVIQASSTVSGSGGSDAATSPVDNSSPNCLHVENLEAHKVENIRRVMESVPRPVYNVLRYLFAFLNHLSEFKDENMMDAYNIAICLAPTLIPVPEDKRDQVNHQTDTIELIKIIIQNSDDVFAMDCTGPLYEKFDSELGDDHDEIDVESEDEEEDESELHEFKMRNMSDDEFYATTEAIALYDYKGRSDKELSFKKGDWLLIKGQLSADWWQGSLAPTATNQPTPAAKYIPDKYIALRSSKRKFSANSTLNQTPERIMSMSMNHQKSFAGTPTSSKSFAKSGSITSSNRMLSNNNMTSSQLTNDSEQSLSELLQGKESDILDNIEDDSVSVISEAVSMILSNNTNNLQQQNYHTIMNKFNQGRYSMSNSSYTSNSSHPMKQSSEIQRRVSLKKQRNLSASSSVIDQPIQIIQNKKEANKNNSISGSPRSLNQQQLINFDNLMNNKQQLKMHHIEDALASVLDDMKQLDFSTSSPVPPNVNANKTPQSTKSNPIIGKNNNSSPSNATNKTISNIVSSLSSSQGPSSSSSSSTSSTSSSSNHGPGSQRVLPTNKNNNDFTDENLSNSSEDEKIGRSDGCSDLMSASSTNFGVAKSVTSSPAVIIGAPSSTKASNGLNKRPDLVLDLPVSLLLSKPSANNINNNNSQPQPVNTSTLPNLKGRRQSDTCVPSALNSSSTSSTESSSMSSTASSTKQRPFLNHNRSASSQVTSLNLQTSALNAATAAVEQALLKKQPALPMISSSELTTNSLSARKKSDTSDVSYALESNSENNVFYDGNSNSTQPEEPKETFKEKLEEFKTTNYCSIDEVQNNIPSPQSDNAIEYVELNNNDDIELRVPSALPVAEAVAEPEMEPSNQGDETKAVAAKKQPPPVMKKPERSEEIMRKLGRSSALDSVSQQTFGTVSSVSSASSSIHDPSVSVSTQSSSNNETSVIRLSHSKATDV